jgi:anti-sigma regulatory factor (Ser/Thr protein kinase)
MTHGTALTFQFPPTDEAPRLARHAVVDSLELTDPFASDVALLISEAVTNSVLHGTFALGSMVHVDAAWHDAVLRIEVCDEGGGVHARSAAEETDPGRLGGHGLQIISAIASRWGLHSDGHTRVWFELAG